MGDKTESSRILFAVAATLFIAHNVLFVLFTVKQFNEEKILKQEYQDQLDRIKLLKTKCPQLKLKQESIWHHVSRASERDHVHKRQTDAMFQQMIMEQELILEKHCSNGTGFCVKGPKGDTGVKGNTGLKGSTGPVGLNGQQGANGTEGLQGTMGVKGLHGDTGGNGKSGLQGPVGLKGETGITGEQGIQGPKGQRGINGTKGLKGAKGFTGLTGDRGAKGDAGIAGIKGTSGTRGLPGQKGSAGPDGTTPFVDPNCTCSAKPYVTGPKNESFVTFFTASVTLNCSVGGNPPPKITWYKDGSSLPSTVQQHGTLLTIPNAQVTDTGDYKCHADNGLGSVEKSFSFKFVLMNCDFERDFCSWTQSQTDKKDWTYHTGSTTSSNTGPSGDHTKGNGHYIYLETSVGKEHDKAELLSPTLDSRHITCLQFWYHMYGVDVNSLKIFLEFTDGTRKAMWTKSGDQGDKWHKGVVSIPVQSKPYKIVIQSIKGRSFQGDIGLDDIHVNDGECLSQAKDMNCDFETDLCYWHQSTTAKMDLIRHNGGTMTSSTGPTIDHTLKSTSGHYLYLESSNGMTGDTATVVSPLVKTNGDMCFSVWYHMHGSGMGTVNIYVQPIGWVKQLTWTRTGPQGTDWREARFTVPKSAKPFYIIIETVKGKTLYSDIAIDDISARPQRCTQQANSFDCDFENQFCNWKQGTKDNFDWQRKSGPQSGGFLGPPADHTLQTMSGHYIYIDPTYAESQTADLQSPNLFPSSIYCLDFWYYLDGSQTGSIIIRRAQYGVNVEKLKEIKVSPGSGWHQQKLGVASFWTSFNLVIEGVRGHATNSYIAVDDIKLSTGVCK